MNKTKIASELIKVAKLMLSKELDIGRVELFKREFLTFMKNVKVVSNYKQAIEWNKYFSKWSNDFEEYIFRYLLENTLKQKMYTGDIDKDTFEYWDKKIRKPLWDFIVECRVPIDFKDDYFTEEDQYRKYLNKVKKWESRVRSKARTAWKVLFEFVEFYESVGDKPLYITEPTLEQMNINGFSVILKSDGYDEHINDNMKKLYKALNIVKSGSSKYISELLKLNVPIYIDLTKRGLDDGGEFKGGKVYIYYSAMIGSVKNIAHVVAHELAHVLYHDKFTNEGRKIWSEFIYGGKSMIDMRDVLKQYGNERFLFDNKKIKKEDPILYLQLEALYNNSAFKNMLRMEDLKNYIEGGGNPIVNVDSKPISGYASKNPEEAFAEAVGLLVVYGKSALLPEVYGMLMSIL